MSRKATDLFPLTPAFLCEALKGEDGVSRASVRSKTALLV